MPSAIPSRRPATAISTGRIPATKRARHTNDSETRIKHPLQRAIASGKGAIAAPTTNGVKKQRTAQFDESRTVVGKGGERSNGDVSMHDSTQEVIDISSDESEDDDDLSDENEVEWKEDADEAEEPAAKKLTNGTSAEDEDVEMANGDEDATAGAERDASPSFGELLQANAAQPIDVEATFVDPHQKSRSLVPANKNVALSAPSATSLGTVLTQALTTNDRELLESCFQLNDLNSVRGTIERLPSHLVSNLLQRLAERLHRRPGRAGNLMVWVQWTLVSHGGYLASQPAVIERLNGLNRVIKDRASGLQPLLTLKGKLDMLSAQLDLRKSMHKYGDMNDENDEAVIYVEGEESSSEEEPEHQDEVQIQAPGSTKPKKPDTNLDFAGFGSSEDEDDEDMPTTTNGFNYSEDEDESEEDDDNDLLDDEAEETENDTGDEETDDDEFDDEIEEEGEDLESEEEESDAPPAKRSLGRRR